MKTLSGIVNPSDTLQRENDKLKRIVEVLVARVENSTNESGVSYKHFESAITLEAQVRARTQELENALELLNKTNGQLVTAIHQAENARSDMQNAIEAIQEGFAMFDANDRLVMTNRRFARFMPDVQAHLKEGMKFSDYIKLVAHSQYRVFNGAQNADLYVTQRLNSHLRKSANFIVEFSGDRWVQISEHRTADNGTVILQTDVTDMVRLERKERDALLDQQAKIVRATLDHIDQGIAIFDAENLLVVSNDKMKTLMKLPVRALSTGSSFHTLSSLFQYENNFTEVEKLIKVSDWVNSKSPRQSLKLELFRDDEAVISLSCNDMPDGSFVITCQDITAEWQALNALSEAKDYLEQRVQERTVELKQARDAAERANASKSRFVAAASHDLLQPINAAKLFISSLERLEMDKDQSVLVGRISNAFASVETILWSLLDISKLDSGNATPQFSVFPIQKLFQTLHDEFAEAAEQKGLKLSVVPCSLYVRSDPTYLRRILQNLLSNAIRYTQKGKVLLGARRQNGEIKLVVQDTGSGLTEAEQKEIFQEFKRLRKFEDDAPGMGLGLAIVERAADMLGYPLNLRSSPGKGTAFSLSLPIAEAPRETSSKNKVENNLDITALLENALILVVDNDHAVLDGMVALLSGWGASPIEARSTSEALEIIDEFGMPPDIVLADFHLGSDDNGITTIQALQQAYGKLPAIIISADRSQELQSRAAHAGIPLLQKPVDPDELRLIVSVELKKEKP